MDRSSSNQMPVTTAARFMVATSVLTTAVANDTVRNGIGYGISSFYGAMKGVAVSCINSVRTAGLSSVRLISPSTQSLFERKVAVDVFGWPISSLFGGSGPEVAGSVSMGTVGHVFATPIMLLAKTTYTTYCRYSESHRQQELTDQALREKNHRSAALTSRLSSLEKEKAHYKKLSERSILPHKTWSGLLMTLAPAVLLTPEIGLLTTAALTVCAVSCGAQMISNAWEKSANRGMLRETLRQVVNVEAKKELEDMTVAYQALLRRVEALEA